jgi:FlaA1/EpsC-like NDP-sugar epimerase
VERLKHPVYRHRLIQLAADAVLIAAAYYLAFRLRFLDAAGGIPDRYDHMLGHTIGFVVVGQLIVLYAFGLYEKWWRYFRLPDMIAVLRACALSTAILAITFLLLKPFDDQIPRSVVVSYFLLTVFLIGGARFAVHAACSSSAPARAARWWSARCSSTRISAHAR